MEMAAAMKFRLEIGGAFVVIVLIVVPCPDYSWLRRHSGIRLLLARCPSVLNYMLTIFTDPCPGLAVS
jgi:hypothetical protein